MAEATDQLAQKPASTASIRLFGFLVIALVFGGLALWTIIAPIDSAVIAPGQIVVESNRKVVQHMDGGMVAAIDVREGDFVKKGDALIELDPTIAKANLALIDGQLAELYARRARLEAERDEVAATATPRGVDSVLNGDLFREKAQGQTQLFEAKHDTRTAQVALLEQRIVQQKERIAGLKTQIKALAIQRRLISDELGGVKTLNEEGYAPMTRVRELEREEQRLTGESGSLRASVAEAESLISEARLEISRLTTTAREESISELRDVEASIVEAEERRVAAADVLKRTTIKAPEAGRVLALNVHTIGGVIEPGSVIMEIVPDHDPLLVAARISPRDIDTVEKGQETLVRFSGLGGRKTPEAQGKVKTVSADSLNDQKTGAPYYLALIELPDANALDAILKGQRLAPGMPAEAYIRTGSRPAIFYLLKPLTDAIAHSMREE